MEPSGKLANDDQDFELCHDPRFTGHDVPLTLPNYIQFAKYGNDDGDDRAESLPSHSNISPIPNYTDYGNSNRTTTKMQSRLTELDRHKSAPMSRRFPHSAITTSSSTAHKSLQSNKNHVSSLLARFELTAKQIFEQEKQQQNLPSSTAVIENDPYLTNSMDPLTLVSEQAEGGTIAHREDDELNDSMVAKEITIQNLLFCGAVPLPHMRQQHEEERAQGQGRMRHSEEERNRNIDSAPKNQINTTSTIASVVEISSETHQMTFSLCGGGIRDAVKETDVKNTVNSSVKDTAKYDVKLDDDTNTRTTQMSSVPVEEETSVSGSTICPMTWIFPFRTSKATSCLEDTVITDMTLEHEMMAMSPLSLESHRQRILPTTTHSNSINGDHNMLASSSVGDYDAADDLDSNPSDESPLVMSEAPQQPKSNRSPKNKEYTYSGSTNVLKTVSFSPSIDSMGRDYDTIYTLIEEDEDSKEDDEEESHVKAKPSFKALNRIPEIAQDRYASPYDPIFLIMEDEEVRFTDAEHQVSSVISDLCKSGSNRSTFGSREEQCHSTYRAAPSTTTSCGVTHMNDDNENSWISRLQSPPNYVRSKNAFHKSNHDSHKREIISLGSDPPGECTYEYGSAKENQYDIMSSKTFPPFSLPKSRGSMDYKRPISPESTYRLRREFSTGMVENKRPTSPESNHSRHRECSLKRMKRDYKRPISPESTHRRDARGPTGKIDVVDVSAKELATGGILLGKTKTTSPTKMRASKSISFNDCARFNLHEATQAPSIQNGRPKSPQQRQPRLELMDNSAHVGNIKKSYSTSPIKRRVLKTSHDTENARSFDDIVHAPVDNYHERSRTVTTPNIESGRSREATLGSELLEYQPLTVITATKSNSTVKRRGYKASLECDKAQSFDDGAHVIVVHDSIVLSWSTPNNSDNNNCEILRLQKLGSCTAKALEIIPVSIIRDGRSNSPQQFSQEVKVDHSNSRARIVTKSKSTSPIKRRAIKARFDLENARSFDDIVHVAVVGSNDEIEVVTTPTDKHNSFTNLNVETNIEKVDAGKRTAKKTKDKSTSHKHEKSNSFHDERTKNHAPTAANINIDSLQSKLEAVKVSVGPRNVKKSKSTSPIKTRRFKTSSDLETSRSFHETIADIPVVDLTESIRTSSIRNGKFNSPLKAKPTIKVNCIEDVHVASNGDPGILPAGVRLQFRNDVALHPRLHSILNEIQRRRAERQLSAIMRERADEQRSREDDEDSAPVDSSSSEAFSDERDESPVPIAGELSFSENGESTSTEVSEDRDQSPILAGIESFLAESGDGKSNKPKLFESVFDEYDRVLDQLLRQNKSLKQEASSVSSSSGDESGILRDRISWIRRERDQAIDLYDFVLDDALKVKIDNSAIVGEGGDAKELTGNKDNIRNDSIRSTNIPPTIRSTNIPPKPDLASPRVDNLDENGGRLTSIDPIHRNANHGRGAQSFMVLKASLLTRSPSPMKFPDRINILTRGNETREEHPTRQKSPLGRNNVDSNATPTPSGRPAYTTKVAKSKDNSPEKSGHTTLSPSPTGLPCVATFEDAYDRPPRIVNIQLREPSIVTRPQHVPRSSLECDPIMKLRRDRSPTKPGENYPAQFPPPASPSSSSSTKAVFISSPEKRRLLGPITSAETRKLRRQLDLARLTNLAIRNSNRSLSLELESFQYKLWQHRTCRLGERDILEACQYQLGSFQQRLKEARRRHRKHHNNANDAWLPSGVHDGKRCIGDTDDTDDTDEAKSTSHGDIDDDCMSRWSEFSEVQGAMLANLELMQSARASLIGPLRGKSTKPLENDGGCGGAAAAIDGGKLVDQDIVRLREVVKLMKHVQS